ncbi:MAG: hypothetical protein LKI32_07255 [Lachnospiraceae bacterium]|nr:hypothetical protein [Lachnospiraceae bacterium]MCI1657338.1 hypothetical protein [Lachnospiraceae bacterium]MCI2195816.1 hypothetical protein [Lachnospiraceae bacterium]
MKYTEIDKLNADFNAALADMKSNVRDIIDMKASLSDEFLSAVRKDKAALHDLRQSDDWKSVAEDLKAHPASSGVQDALDGIFATRGLRILPWGHGEKYYNQKYNDIKYFGLHKILKNVYQEMGYDVKSQWKCSDLCRDYETASEAWASITSAETLQDDALQYVKKYLPNSYKMFKKIIKKAGGK